MRQTKLQKKNITRSAWLHVHASGYNERRAAHREEATAEHGEDLREEAADGGGGAGTIASPWKFHRQGIWRAPSSRNMAV